MRSKWTNFFFKSEIIGTDEWFSDPMEIGQRKSKCIYGVNNKKSKNFYIKNTEKPNLKLKLNKKKIPAI